jgi:hypothetical protein
MKRVEWNTPTHWDTVKKRAAGRRHYNAWRGWQRLKRRQEVIKLLEAEPILSRGTYSRIARALGVHRCTITRDIKAMIEDSREYEGAPDRLFKCPTCRHLVTGLVLAAGKVFIDDEDEDDDEDNST